MKDQKPKPKPKAKPKPAPKTKPGKKNDPNNIAYPGGYKLC